MSARKSFPRKELPAALADAERKETFGGRIQKIRSEMYGAFTFHAGVLSARHP